MPSRSTSIIHTTSTMSTESITLPTVTSVTRKMAKMSARKGAQRGRRTDKGEADSKPRNIYNVQILLKKDVKDRIREHIEACVLLNLICKVVGRGQGRDEVMLRDEQRVNAPQSAQSKPEDKDHRTEQGNLAVLISVTSPEASVIVTTSAENGEPLSGQFALELMSRNQPRYFINSTGRPLQEVQGKSIEGRNRTGQNRSA